MVKRVKNAVQWTYVISYLKSAKAVGIFYEKELQKANQTKFTKEKVTKFRKEKVTKGKSDNLYVK